MGRSEVGDARGGFILDVREFSRRHVVNADLVYTGEELSIRRSYRRMCSVCRAARSFVVTSIDDVSVQGIS